MSSDGSTVDMATYDPVQAALMEEVCILLDREDRVTGKATKKVCHLMTNIDQGMLHRAFSVFLFNSKGELLLQQRASSKITFPDTWTNTCCSHPLYVPDEMVEENQMGVRRAAQRKLDNELGIDQSQIDLEAFQYITRIYYKAPSDGMWGEHEIDYILFLQQDIECKPNPEEIRATRYVNQAQLKELMEEAKKDPNVKLTPWFSLMADKHIFKWWDALLDGTLANLRDGLIHYETN